MRAEYIRTLTFLKVTGYMPISVFYSAALILLFHPAHNRFSGGEYVRPVGEKPGKAKEEGSIERLR